MPGLRGKHATAAVRRCFVTARLNEAATTNVRATCLICIQQSRRQHLGSRHAPTTPPRQYVHARPFSALSRTSSYEGEMTEDMPPSIMPPHDVFRLLRLPPSLASSACRAAPRSGKPHGKVTAFCFLTALCVYLPLTSGLEVLR